MPLKMLRKMDYNIKGSSKKAPMGKAFSDRLAIFINYGNPLFCIELLLTISLSCDILSLEEADRA